MRMRITFYWLLICRVNLLVCQDVNFEVLLQWCVWSKHSLDHWQGSSQSECLAFALLFRLWLSQSPFQAVRPHPLIFYGFSWCFRLIDFHTIMRAYDLACICWTGGSYVPPFYPQLPRFLFTLSDSISKHFFVLFQGGIVPNLWLVYFNWIPTRWFYLSSVIISSLASSASFALCVCI